MKVLRGAWRVLRAMKTLLLVILLALSLSFNVTMFVGGKLYTAGSVAFEAITGRQSLASQYASDLADLNADLINERRANQKLQGEVADLGDELVSERRVTQKLRGEVVDLGEDLVNERRVATTLRGQLDDATQRVVTYRGKRMAVSQAVDITADTIDARAVRTATRSVSSTFGEAVPYVGTAVIVGVTALELKDLCDTLKDMDELRRAFNPNLPPSNETTTICAMEVPSREDIWEMVKESPGAAWDKAREFTPSLAELKTYDFPDFDLETYKNKARELFGKAKESASAAVENAQELLTEDDTEE